MFPQIRSRHEARRFRLRSQTNRKSATIARTLSRVVAILPLIFNSALASQLVDYEVTGRKSHAFSLEAVCRSLGHKHNLLVDREDQLNVNCMGEKAKVLKHCKKQELNEPLLRAYIPKPGKDVPSQAYCITGKQARLSISCESKKTRHYCRDPKAACQKLRKSYAKDLELAHYNRKMRGAKESLVCHYGSTRVNEKANLISPDAKDSLKTGS